MSVNPTVKPNKDIADNAKTNTKAVDMAAQQRIFRSNR